jgi:glycine cleavage system protein P-like pyridoxal-binding family
MTRLIYERSQTGRRASSLPAYDLPAVEVPPELARSSPPRLPEVAEPELVRHFTELSTRNFGIDTGSTSGSSAFPASATCIRCRRKTARRARSS